VGAQAPGLHLRPPPMPIRAALKFLANGDERVLGKWQAHKLDRHRKVIGEAAGQRERRQPGEIAGGNQRAQSLHSAAAGRRSGDPEDR
jgi:hypothetical protein